MENGNQLVEASRKCNIIRKKIISLMSCNFKSINEVLNLIKRFNMDLMSSHNQIDRKLSVIFLTFLIQKFINYGPQSRNNQDRLANDKLVSSLQGPFLLLNNHFVFLTFQQAHLDIYRDISHKMSSKSNYLRNQTDVIFCYPASKIESKNDKLIILGVSLDRSLQILSKPELLCCLPDPKDTLIIIDLKQGNRLTPFHLTFIQINHQEWSEKFKMEHERDVEARRRKNRVLIDGVTKVGSPDDGMIFLSFEFEFDDEYWGRTITSAPFSVDLLPQTQQKSTPKGLKSKINEALIKLKVETTMKSSDSPKSQFVVRSNNNNMERSFRINTSESPKKVKHQNSALRSTSFKTNHISSDSISSGIKSQTNSPSFNIKNTRPNLKKQGLTPPSRLLRQNPISSKDKKESISFQDVFTESISPLLCSSPEVYSKQVLGMDSNISPVFNQKQAARNVISMDLNSMIFSRSTAKKEDHITAPSSTLENKRNLKLFVVTKKRQDSVKSKKI